MAEIDKKIESILDNLINKVSNIEDIVIQNRNTIIELANQGNKIVDFLRHTEIQEIPDDEENLNKDDLTKMDQILDEYISKHHDLLEFQRELEKYKDKFTSRQVGET